MVKSVWCFKCFPFYQIIYRPSSAILRGPSTDDIQLKWQSIELIFNAYTTQYASLYFQKIKLGTHVRLSFPKRIID